MFSAILTKNPYEIILEDSPIPQLEADELLIKVQYCGVCGSDLHAYSHAKGYEFVKKPRILGHEIAGIVVKSGDASLTNRVGQQVIIESMQYCRNCEHCNAGRYSICKENKVIGLHEDGGMAEYVKAKANNVKGVFDLELDIAVLSEPMAVAVHAVNKVGSITAEDIISIHGSGIIGFFVGIVCLERGAKVYISGLKKDYETRLAKFKRFHMIPIVAEQGRIDEKVDVVFECSGSNHAVTATFKQLKKGGKAVVVALYEQETEIFLTHLVRNEWDIITSYGSNPVDYDDAICILKKYKHQLKSVMSYYPFEKTKEAFEDGIHQQVLKPIISMNTM